MPGSEVSTDDELIDEEYTPPPPPRRPPEPRGEWKTYASAASGNDDAVLKPRRPKPFIFYVRATADEHASKLRRITLPHSWAQATIGRLVEYLSARFSLPSWDLHIKTARGAVGTHLVVTAALVRRETVDLARGPSPASGGARNRRTLWVWGRCVDGTITESPCRQPTLGAHQIVRVAVGDEHVLALTTASLVLSWGRNDCGQLGTGDERALAAPRVVRTLAAAGRCVEVAAGARCSGVIDARGELWAFGANQPANHPLRFHSSWANARGATACGTDVRAVAFGLSHALLLTRSGLLWSWGYNDCLQLGWADALASPVLRNGFQKPRSPLADLPTDIVSIACGEAHSACLCASGELYAWGDNSTGQCGGGHSGRLTFGQSVPTASLVSMPRGDTLVCRVHCFGNATLAICESGRAYMIGGGGRLRTSLDDDDDEEEEEEEGGERRGETRRRWRRRQPPARMP